MSIYILLVCSFIEETTYPSNSHHSALSRLSPYQFSTHHDACTIMDKKGIPYSTSIPLVLNYSNYSTNTLNTCSSSFSMTARIKGSRLLSRYFGFACLYILTYSRRRDSSNAFGVQEEPVHHACYTYELQTRNWSVPATFGIHVVAMISDCTMLLVSDFQLR
jgi:hypothetical protein